MRFRSIITAKHEALTAPSFNWALMAAEYRAETNWCTRRAPGNQDNHHFDCRTPSSEWQKSHTIVPDEFKMTSIASNGCNWPPDTGEVATAPLSASIPGGNLESSDTKWRTRRDTDIKDDDHEYKTIPTSQLSEITSPSTYNRRSNLTPECGHIENQGEVRRFTSQHSHDYISSNSAKCTYLSFIPTDTRLERWISTEEDLSTNQALLPPRTSARAKCTYGEDTLRWKRTYSGDILRSVMCIYGQRQTQFRRPSTTTTTTTTTITTMTMKTSEHKYYGQSKLT